MRLTPPTELYTIIRNFPSTPGAKVDGTTMYVPDVIGTKGVTTPGRASE